MVDLEPPCPGQNLLKKILQQENATRERVKDQGIGKETEQDFTVM